MSLATSATESITLEPELSLKDGFSSSSFSKLLDPELAVNAGAGSSGSFSKSLDPEDVVNCGSGSEVRSGSRY